MGFKTARYTALVLLVASCGGSPRYDVVRQWRPIPEVAWTERVRIDDRSNMRLLRDGALLSENPTVRQIQLEAEVRVVAIDGAGRVSSYDVRVAQFLVDEGSGVREVSVPPELRIALDGDTRRFEPEVDPHTGELLLAALGLGAGGPGEDVYGLGSGLRAVGTEWPIDREAAARDLTAEWQEVGPDDVTGSSRLELRACGEMECLVRESWLDATTHIRWTGVPGPFEGEGSHRERASVEWRTDSRMPPLRSSWRTEVNFEVPAETSAGPLVVAYSAHAEFSVERE